MGDANVEPPLQPRKRKATTEGAAGDDNNLLGDGEDGVEPVVVMERSKHRDGTLYEPRVDVFRWLYNLESSSETSSMQPMRLTLPTAECPPTPTTSCGRHVGGATLQIFSVKLAKLPPAAAAGGPIQLYGFMAIRDLMDPRRNYVFNRGREDPLVIPDPNSDPFVYLPGPKRSVNMQARVMFEYDVRIKRGGEEECQDLPLIDEVAIFSEKTCNDQPSAYRIRGGGAVDITWARLTRAMEATVQVWIQELAPPPPPPQQQRGNGGLDLSVSGLLTKIPVALGEEIKLFRGVVDKPCALDRFLVAVPASLESDLILRFKAHATAVGSPSHHIGDFIFRVAAHGSVSVCRKFDFATVQVNVTWSAPY